MNSLRPISDFFVKPYKTCFDNYELLRNKKNNLCTKDKIILIALSILELVPVLGNLALHIQNRYFNKVSKIENLQKTKVRIEPQELCTETKAGVIFKSIVEFAIGDFFNATALNWLHENGHAIAMKAMYGFDKKIKIELNDEGGTCNWPVDMTPSNFGRFFSENSQKVIVFAAGPIIQSIATSILAFKVSPEFALPSAINTAIYALQPIFGLNKDLAGHDHYYVLDKGGPIAYGATLAICLTPLVISIGLMAKKYLNIFDKSKIEEQSNKTTPLAV